MLRGICGLKRFHDSSRRAIKVLLKYKSIISCHTRFPCLLLLFFIPLLTVILLPRQVQGQKYPGTPMIQKDATGKVKRYKTASGELTATWLLLFGSQLTKAGSKMEFKEGYFAVSSDGGVPITNPVQIFKGKPYQVLTPLEITFVQDRISGAWLATNGLLYVRKQQGYLLEGQRVRVIGGKDKPLFLDGQPFADANLVILNGKPVKKTW
jgi:hypothetical protein